MRAHQTTVQIGIEVLLAEGLPQLAGKLVGLITNPTGVDRHFRSTVDLLRESRHVRLVALFGPEHGVRGDAQAGTSVESTVDARTGLPVHSLYGATERPTPAMLDGLDALIFDIQDFGVRYATYASTMAHAQAAAADAGLTFVVLDRPNPLGGTVEGNLLQPAFTSFVGVHPLPIRHGLTAGELARLFAADHGWPAPIVVPIHGWRRSLWFDQTGLPWVLPSPNLPTLDTLTLYSGTCLLEGTNVSEGRGTTRPFELLGAPWIDPYDLAHNLTERMLPGVAFRPTYFRPISSKHAGTTCGGVQVHILDRTVLRAPELGIHLLHALRKLGGEDFAWIERPGGGYFIDLLLGSDTPRHALDAGTTVAEVVAGWDDDAHTFEQRSQPFRLYPV